MGDDQLSREYERERFEAIVSDLVDPDLLRLRRLFLGLGLVLFCLGTTAVAVVGGLGWPGVLAFSSTFVPGLLLAERLKGRGYARPRRRFS